jgi:hypothetical protein
MLILTTCGNCTTKFWEDEPHYMCTSCSETICAECTDEADDETGRCVCLECAIQEAFCACCAPLVTEAEQRDQLCRGCL